MKLLARSFALSALLGIGVFVIGIGVVEVRLDVSYFATDFSTLNINQLNLSSRGQFSAFSLWHQGYVTV